MIKFLSIFWFAENFTFLYNDTMSILQFLVMAVVCAFETYFFNEAVFNGDYLIAILWGIFLVRDLQRVYRVTKFTKSLLAATKKKD